MRQNALEHIRIIWLYMLHGEFLGMSFIEYTNTFTSRQQRTRELQRFFETT